MAEFWQRSKTADRAQANLNRTATRDSGGIWHPDPKKFNMKPPKRSIQLKDTPTLDPSTVPQNSPWDRPKYKDPEPNIEDRLTDEDKKRKRGELGGDTDLPFGIAR